MPRSKKKVVEETSVAVQEQEIPEVVEVTPKKLYVEVRHEVPLPQYRTTGSVPVGTMTYYESTGEFIVTSEVEFNTYMRDLGNRDIRLLDGTWVQITHRKEWMENFPKSVLESGFFADEVRVLNEDG